VNDVLNFQLPFFSRRSWASEEARQVWEPRLERTLTAWREMEWQSVRAGIRGCAAIVTLASDRPALTAKCAAAGLSVIPVMNVRGSSGFQVAIGKLSACDAFGAAVFARDLRAQGEALGYPGCCIAAYQESVVRSSPADPVWLAALRTSPAEEDGHAVTIPGESTLDLLCHALGMWRTFHIPCRFDCGPSMELAVRIRDLGERLGYREEMQWLDDIFSWPVEWSALHGIAETKTPVLRVSTRAVATASRYAIRFLGTAFPAEGSRGLSFPFRIPHHASAFRVLANNGN
jgi:hypothetical protein